MDPLQTPCTPPRKYRRLSGSVLSSPSMPDRFITPRRSISSGPDTLRVSKPPHELTPAERMYRKRPRDSDPFMSRRVTPDAKTRLAMTPQPFGVARNASSSEAHHTVGTRRSISAGSVWRVGGISSPSSPTAAISDGRGGLLGSGTNAPMFSANFFDSETDDQGAVPFEGRIAAALELDQCRRVLDVSPPPKRSRPSAERYADPEFPTVWKDGRWYSAKGRLVSLSTSEWRYDR